MYDIEGSLRPDGAFPLLECVRSESPRGNLISLRKFLERSLQVEKRGNEREPYPKIAPLPPLSQTDGPPAAIIPSLSFKAGSREGHISYERKGGL